MFEGIERIAFSKDWITVILMLVLALITIVRFVYSERFSKLFSLLYSEKYYSDYLKNKPLVFNKFHFLLFLVLIINVSLLVFFSFKAFIPSKISNDFTFFIQVLILVILYIFIRYFIGYFLGIIFDIYEHQKYVTFLKISNLSFISILIFPLLVLINFSSVSLHKFILIFSIIIILILLFIRYYTILKNERINFNNLFYLFLYLCALEIAPFIVIYKIFVY